MKIIRLFLIMMLLMPAASAGAQAQKREQRRDRTEWMQKMKEFKHAYLVRELDLSEKQSEDFFKVYDAREEERFEAERRVRRLEREIARKGQEATEEELDRCITEQHRLNRTLADIDAKYESTLRKVLTKRQLVRLPHIERDFQRKLMEQRRECRPPKPQNP